jgi:hypothetical protein
MTGEMYFSDYDLQSSEDFPNVEIVIEFVIDTTQTTEFWPLIIAMDVV